MKLIAPIVGLVVGLLLAGGASSALADQRDPQGPQAVQGAPGARGPQAGARRHHGRLKARLVQRFDRDGDGRLTGRERLAARRFVQRLHHRRMAHGRGQGGASR